MTMRMTEPTTVMPVRIAVYYRVSTSEQSIASQRSEVRAYIQRRWGASLSSWRMVGDHLVAEDAQVEVHEYEETESGSGKKRRPVFEAVRQAAHKREFQVLLVARLDRFGRNLYELVGTLEDLSSLGISFVSVAEGHDTATAAGRALFQVAGVFAEWERSINNERTRAGLKAARARGSRLGRPSTVATRLTDAVVRAAVQEHGSCAKAAKALAVSAWSVQRAWHRIRAAETVAQELHAPQDDRAENAGPEAA